MAKAKKQTGKKKSKRDAIDVDGSTGAMLIPAPRDLKHHLSVIQIKKAAVDKANKELAFAYKVADEAGINTNAVRKGLALHKKDQLAAKSEMVQLSLVLQELGSGVQFNVHEAKYEDAVEEASVKGFADGKAGRGQNHPYVKASPAARAYDEGYAKGQLENMPIDPKVKAKLKAEGEPALTH